MINRIFSGVFVCLALFGMSACGGSSGSSPTPAPTLVPGAWTGKAASTQGYGTSIVVADVKDQGAGSFFATESTMMICAQFDGGCLQSLPQLSSGICCRYRMTMTVTDGKASMTITKVSAAVPPTSLGTITVTGNLASDGKSMTGTYSATYTDGTPSDSGNWTASVGTSVTGNYGGTLRSKISTLSFPVTASVTEQPVAGRTIKATAMVSGSSCLGALTFVDQGTVDHSFAVGGAFHLWSPSPQVYADVIPNGDGSFAVSWAITTATCSDSGTGALTLR